MSETAIAEARTEKTIEVHNPATGQPIGSVPLLSPEAARDALDRVRAAQAAWGSRPLRERTDIIWRFSERLSERGREVAELLSRENGKTLQEAFTMEIFPIVSLASYFCRHAERILRPQRIRIHFMAHKWSQIEYRPRGVVFIISPWNFPFSIPTGEVLMSLIAGNAVLHKPASLTPLIALKCRELLLEAGLPEDVYRVITCEGRVAFDLIGPGVDYVNFTGSTEIGQRVAERCGRNLIPCSMELGGKDPMVVLDDADLDRAANAAVWGAFANSGQVCASVERVYVPRPLHDTFVSKVVERAKSLRQGDPVSVDSDVGAMTDEGQREIVRRQVEAAKAAGAIAHTGGVEPAGPGRFYPPTVLTGCNHEMDVVKEETFGPVLPILPYDSVDEAVARANDTPYGLTASVFGRDEVRALEVARRIQAGTVMLNDVLFTHAVAETPWSGVKRSGTGRVHSDEGLRDLCLRIHINGNRLPLLKREIMWYPYSKTGLKVFAALTSAFAGRIVPLRLLRFLSAWRAR